jgi:hypothetical protein
MTDREQDPTAALGRVLSWIGYLWFVFAVLWGMGVIEALGLSGSVASGIGGTVFPAIILIGVGRVLRRRARSAEESIRPDVSRGPEPTPPILPGPDPRVNFPPPQAPRAPRPPPRTVTPPQAVVVEPTEAGFPGGEAQQSSPDQDLDPTTGSPKTSQELIEEARRRWGSRP